MSELEGLPEISTGAYVPEKQTEAYKDSDLYRAFKAMEANTTIDSLFTEGRMNCGEEYFYEKTTEDASAKMIAALQSLRTDLGNMPASAAISEKNILKKKTVQELLGIRESLD